MFSKKDLEKIKEIVENSIDKKEAMQEVEYTFGHVVSFDFCYEQVKSKLGVSLYKVLGKNREKDISTAVFWNESNIEKAINILKKHTTLTDALKEMNKTFKRSFGRERIRRMFKKHGYNPPSTYCSTEFGSAGRKSKPTFWTEEKIEEAKRILRKHSSVKAAVKEMNRTFKRKFKSRELNSAFKKNEAKYPSYYCTAGTEISVENELSKLIDVVKRHEKKGRLLNLRTLCDILDYSPAKVEKLIDDALMFGYDIKLSDNRLELNRDLDTFEVKRNNLSINRVEKNTIRFAVISDTHYGSNVCMPEVVKDFVDLVYNDYGVTNILHCGDLLAGNGVYKGQSSELDYWGCDQQCNFAAEQLPEKKDLQYHFITGNHDISFFKKSGIDIGKKMVDLRKDMIFLGPLDQKLFINDKIQAQLLHLKSTAHARSYSLEKFIHSSVSKANQPDLIFCGHKHTNGYFEIQQVHAFLIPCFEDPSLFLRYNGMSPSIGGLVIDVILDDDDNIVGITQSFKLYHF